MRDCIRRLALTELLHALWHYGLASHNLTAGKIEIMLIWNYKYTYATKIFFQHQCVKAVVLIIFLSTITFSWALSEIMKKDWEKVLESL